MAWTTPPTFADTPSGPHDADDFNALILNVVELSAASSTINPPFSTHAMEAGYTDETDGYWMIRHMHQYLHYRVEILDGATADFKISYNSDLVLDDGTNNTAGYVYSGVIDLYDTGILAVTPTVGNWYRIYVESEPESGGDLHLFVAYIIEHPEAVI